MQGWRAITSEAFRANARSHQQPKSRGVSTWRSGKVAIHSLGRIHSHRIRDHSQWKATSDIQRRARRHAQDHTDDQRCSRGCFDVPFLAAGSVQEEPRSSDGRRSHFDLHALYAQKLVRAPNETPPPNRLPVSLRKNPPTEKLTFCRLLLVTGTGNRRRGTSRIRRCARGWSPGSSLARIDRQRPAHVSSTSRVNPTQPSAHKMAAKVSQGGSIEKKTKTRVPRTRHQRPKHHAPIFKRSRRVHPTRTTSGVGGARPWTSMPRESRPASSSQRVEATAPRVATQFSAASVRLVCGGRFALTGSGGLWAQRRALPSFVALRWSCSAEGGGFIRHRTCCIQQRSLKKKRLISTCNLWEYVFLIKLYVYFLKSVRTMSQIATTYLDRSARSQ